MRTKYRMEQRRTQYIYDFVYEKSFSKFHKTELLMNFQTTYSGNNTVSGKNTEQEMGDSHITSKLYNYLVV